MIYSPYRTKLTSMIQNGERNPERNMEKNEKSKFSQSGRFRRERWVAKSGKDKAA